jgi:ABC-type uncharacterized transport system substrate-binding protein
MVSAMGKLLRFVALCCVIAWSIPAYAHPHVWITVHTELIYAPNGAITAVRHVWAFDDMFSTFMTQGLQSQERGKFTREELAPLAKTNIDSFKEFDYFTYATADGKKIPFGSPSDYWLDYTDSVLTVHFTLPFETPVNANELKLEIYDPTIFISFAFAKEKPVKFAGAPQCSLDIELPRAMTGAERMALSQIAADVTNTTMAWGAKFANKIVVHCLEQHDH